MPLKNDQVADQLASLIGQFLASTIDENQLETALLTMLNDWLISNHDNMAHVFDLLGRLEGWIIVDGPPTDEQGTLNTFAFDKTNQAFYGPKTSEGWGSPDHLNAPLWSAILGKPASFTPSAHSHSADDITTGQLHIDRLPNVPGSKLTGTAQASFIPAAVVTQHDDAIAPLWASVRNTPTTAAGYNISDVYTTTQVDDALALKADSSALAALAYKATITGGDIDLATITEDRLSASVVEKLNRSAKNNFAAVFDPTGTDDSASGYAVGSRWLNTVTDESWLCVDATPGLAVWVKTTLTIDELGTLAFQNADNVDITGGSIDVGVLRRNGFDAWTREDFDPADKADANHGHSAATAVADGFMTAALYQKLNDIQPEATKNDTDAALRARANHTGTQPQSTIDNLEADLAAKLNDADLPYEAHIKRECSDTATDLAQVSPVVIGWDVARSTDASMTVGGPGDSEVTFLEAGQYDVEAVVAYEDRSTAGSGLNNSLIGHLRIGGVAHGIDHRGAVIADEDGHRSAAVRITDRLNVSVGQVLTVHVERGSGSDPLYNLANQSRLIITRAGGKSAALAGMTDEEVRDAYERNTDRNAFTDVEQAAVSNLPADTNATLAAKADLDGSNKVPMSQLPDSIVGGVIYQGVWDAATNAPAIPPAAAANKGHYYKVSVAGSTSVDGQTDWSVGDNIVSNGASWDKIDNTEPDVIGQAEAEAGVATVQRTVTAQRMRQAADAAIAAAGVSGGGVAVEAVQSAAFTPQVGRAYPIDASAGPISLSGMPGSAQQGDRFELHDPARTWGAGNAVTVPATAVNINGRDKSQILTVAGGRVIFEYIDAVWGWEMKVLSPSARDEYTAAFVATPAITVPADGATEVGDGETLTTTVFAISGGSDTHATTDVQIASDAGFSNIVVETVDNAASLEAWQIPSLSLAVSTTYYARARHTGATLGDSDWSATVSFTTAASFQEPETTTLVGQMVVAPSVARRNAIDALIAGLKTDGIWSKLDLLYSTASHTAQASHLNWINPTGPALLPVNGPTFVADQGYAGDGNTSYLDTQVALTALSNYAQDSASLGVWVRSAGSNHVGVYFGVIDAFLGRFTNSAKWFADGPNSSDRIDGNTAAEAAEGLLIANRSSSTTIERYFNATLEASTTGVSDPVSANAPYVLVANSSGSPITFSTAQVSIVFAGSSLTATDVANLHARFSTYLSAIGAI